MIQNNGRESLFAGSPQDYTHRPVSGDLTADGIQTSTAVATTTADTDVVIFSTTINPENSGLGRVKYIELGLTAAFKAVSSATADLIWKWQIKNSSAGSWTDLHSAVTETNIGTTYVERTRQGYSTVPTEVPFDLRLILQCNEANEGSAYVKNSTYARVIFI